MVKMIKIWETFNWIQSHYLRQKPEWSTLHIESVQCKLSEQSYHQIFKSFVFYLTDDWAVNWGYSISKAVSINKRVGSVIVWSFFLHFHWLWHHHRHVFLTVNALDGCFWDELSIINMFYHCIEGYGRKLLFFRKFVHFAKAHCFSNKWRRSIFLLALVEVWIWFIEVITELCSV